MTMLFWPSTMAKCLDFRRFDHDEYVSRLWAWAGALCANPTSPDNIVDRWLGVGAAYTKPGCYDLLDALSARQFSAAALDLLFQREKRTTVLDRALRTQRLTHEQLHLVLTKMKSTDAYDYALSESEYFALRENPFARDIVEHASPTGRLYALAFRVLPLEEEDAATWLAEWSYGVVDSTRWDEWSFLVQRRTDLYGLLVEFLPVVSSFTLRYHTDLARSVHLCSLEHQRLLIGLDLPVSRWHHLLQWATQYAGVVLALLDNPRCHAEVVHEVRQRLVPLAGGNADIDRVRDALTARLATLDERPPYPGDLATESDEDIAAWLSAVAIPADLRGRRYLEPLLRTWADNPVLLVSLDSDVQNELCRRLDSAGSRRDRPWSNTKSLDWYSMALTGWALKSLPAMHLEDLNHAHLQDIYTYMQDELGSEWNRYETLRALSDTWTGTFGQLVTTAKELN